MSEFTIEVSKREEMGKNANRRVRAEGLVPAVVYGGGKASVPIQVDHTKVLELLRSASGENTVFLLKLAGGGAKRHAMIRELQINPVSRQITHIDFQRILMSQKVTVRVPVELGGLAEGVKSEGGMVDFITREVEVECLPAAIPQKFEIDITPLHVGQHLEAGDLEMPEAVALKEDPHRVIVSVAHARVAAVEALEEEEEELIEAEAEEPEVIRRGKGEEESKEGEAAASGEGKR